MGFIRNYGARNDMQEDTFGALSKVLYGILIAQDSRDVKSMHSGMDVFFCLLHSKMKPEEVSDFDERLQAINSVLYSRSSQNPLIMSELYDECRLLWRDFTRVLNRMGLLTRMFSDPNILVTQRADL